MPERNAPCPCGSGKKYKKCCSLTSTHADAPSLFVINRAIAYQGEVGRRRQAFCKAYAAAKEEGLAGIEARLRHSVAEMGQTITCHKCCGHCCDVYVFANLQESENIVHYLYEHEEVLQHYLQQYPLWKEKVDRLGTTLPDIDKAQEKVLFGTATESDRQTFNNGLIAYAAMANPCPFLRESACTIYKVRPYVCAGVVSVSPSTYCTPGHPAHGDKFLVKADFLPQNDMPYFIPTKAAINFGCMPALVQQILKYGYAFLSTIEGLEDLHHQATDDPEVRAVLMTSHPFPRPN
jgi:Fe-S-cluster containining protein